MKSKTILAILVAVSIVAAGCINGDDSNGAEVEVVYMSGCGTMPLTLANGQIDAYIAWQPNVAIAEVSGVGKVITYSKDLPPDGKWENHPCCVINVTQDFAQEHYDVAKYLTMVMIIASEYVQENPDIAARDSAEWIFGGDDLTFGDTTVSSYDVEEASIPTINFTTTPTDDWIEGVLTFVRSAEEINMVTDKLKGKTDAEINDILFHPTLYDDAINALNSKDYLDAQVNVDEVVEVDFGYLAADDHDAALYVAAYEWEYFRDNYGIYFSPIKLGPRGTYQLVVNDTIVAKINTFEFAGGSAEMTAASQGNIDYGLAGAPPVILFIDKGAPVNIICPLMTEGSGVVVSIDAPFDDWDGFIKWIKESYDEGKTVKIGDPMIGSIQDVMIKYALKEEGITIKN